MKPQKPYIYAALAGLLAVAFALGYAANNFLQSQREESGYPIRQGTREYKLIDPLLAYEVSDSKNFLKFKPLEKKMGDFIAQKEAVGAATDIGVYFRDFDSGKWTGVNEDDKFSPASLLKVPLMIAYFKAAESDPKLLSQQIVYGGSFDDNARENLPPLKQIERGHSYSVNELLDFMISYSDNNATRLLFDSLDQSSLKEVFSDLGAPFPNPGEVGDYMSPKSYAFFYRVLYSATYLNRASSEKALELLAKPDFPQGLAAGVPANIVVAQKFGEHSFESVNAANNKELHDCGVIYHPKHTYLLCVMTKGKDFLQLSGVIRDMSKLVYDEVETDYK